MLKRPFYIFLVFFPLYVLSMGGHGYGGVGTSTYDVTRSLVLRKSVAIQQVPWGKFGEDGRFYAQYGIGHSLYNLPFYLTGHGLTALIPRLSSQYDRLTMFTTLLGQPFISALTVVLVWFLCNKLGYEQKTSLLCALFYGFGTQVWMYAQLDFSEPILTFFLAGTLYWVYDPEASERPPKDSHFFLAGLFLGIAITVKVVALIVLPGSLLYILALPHPKPATRLRRLVIFIVPVCLFGIGIVGAYNAVRFGSPLETGYDNEFNVYSRHVLQQFWTNLAGLEGSIFLYSPVILLAVFGINDFYKRAKRFAILVFGTILCFFLFYPFTTNELYYGPRYLTPALPLFMLIAGCATDTLSGVVKRGRRVLPGSLLTFGFAQQVIGVVVNYHTYYWRIHYTMPDVAEAIRLSPEGQMLLNTPKLPHILGHLWLIKQAFLDIFQPGGMPFSGVTLLADATRQNAWIPYYGLDLWWCHPSLISMTGWIFSGAIVLILASVTGVALYKALKLSST